MDEARNNIQPNKRISRHLELVASEMEDIKIKQERTERNEDFLNHDSDKGRLYSCFDNFVKVECVTEDCGNDDIGIEIKRETVDSSWDNSVVMKEDNDYMDSCKNVYRRISKHFSTGIVDQDHGSIGSMNGLQIPEPGKHTKPKHKVKQETKINTRFKQTHIQQYDSKLCNKSFEDEGGFNFHAKTHAVTLYKCVHCDKEFTTAYNLKSHMLTHNIIKPFVCTVCGRSFRRCNDLKNHVLTHSGTKPYKCDICGKEFSQSGNFKTHSLKHRGVMPYECTVCGRAFPRSNDLKTHSMTHNDVKPFECSVCNKAFSQSGNLKKHLLIHSGIKPHKCSFCGKNFSQYDAVKKHLLTHSGLKQHKCTICYKVFGQHQHLKTHFLTHSNIKSLMCSVCSKVFGRADNLKRHMLIHSDYRPCKCSICGKAFSLSHHLKNHLLTHIKTL